MAAIIPFVAGVVATGAGFVLSEVRNEFAKSAKRTIVEVSRNGPCGKLRTVVWAASVAAAAFGGWRLRRHRRSCFEPDVAERLGLLPYVIDGHHYEPGTRDCLPGESHDVIVEEDQQTDEVATSDSHEAGDGNEPAFGGLRGPATRRVQKRKKFVHKTDVSGGAHMPYLSHVVAEARNQYATRVANSHNIALARSYMVRLMQQHGMRATHINEVVDMMVVAVFLVTEPELHARRVAAELAKHNRLRLSGLE
jgi:hypothetical protein